MQAMRSNRCLGLRLSSGRAAAHAFTLIELLTVVFIIGLLIAILVPSINLARNAAKNAKTASLLRVIETGLEMSKQEGENERYFRATNGYPPSFAHPLIPGYTGFTRTDARQGRFPYSGSSGSHPKVYGAHWLAFFLMGKDGLGYIPPKSVRASIRDEPFEWYLPEPSDNKGPLDRTAAYVDADRVRTLATSKLPGRSLAESLLFPDWDTMNDLPVIVDAFDQTVLYYASNTHGNQANMVSPVHREDNDYSSEGGSPFYFHEDNAGFTGDNSKGSDANGWDFSSKARQKGGVLKLHRISDHGDQVDPDVFGTINETFQEYILDKNALNKAPQPVPSNWPRVPVRRSSFLLITAGVDGIYGTNDDVTNLPRFDE